MVVFGVVGPPETRAKAKIGQFYVTLSVDKDVVRLDVTVDEAHGMHALNSAGQLSDVESAIIKSWIYKK